MDWFRMYGEFDSGPKVQSIPVSKGGSHDENNLTTDCFSCNRSKGDKLIDEWRQK